MAETPSTSRAPQSLAARFRRLTGELGRVRLATTSLLLIAAALLAALSWRTPLMSNAERALYDFRSALLSPRVDQDKRISLVVYNDDTLIDTKKRSPLDRATLARALKTLDGMGAKAIGIDILFDQPQDEDDQLIDAFRSMKTPTWLAYADFKSNKDQISFRQQEFLDGFIGRLKGSNVRPASIRLSNDSDNVVRRWPNTVPGLPPLLSRAMVGNDPQFADYQGAIIFRLPAKQAASAGGGEESSPVFSSLAIDSFSTTTPVPELTAMLAQQIKGRYVLIGGDIVDVDQFDTPIRGAIGGKQMIGLEVHAHMLAQMLDHDPLNPLPAWAGVVLALLVVCAGGLTSLAQWRGLRSILFSLLQITFFGGLPFWLQKHGVDTTSLPAFGWIVGWIIAFATVGSAAQQVGAQQRKFAQSALGKYLPRDIANEILAEPDRLALHGEKRELFIVFTDLEGFTALSHQIDPETVARLLNHYLDLLCGVVLKYGGTIDKFVGDAVVAFWGAPISRPDDGERAARAAYAMWEAGEEFRKTVPPGTPPIGKTRVGFHFGEAIVGNFGGEGRIQYTALGDSMNTASRLESSSKKLETSVIASREAAERSGLDWWRPMGRVQLRGRAAPVDIFEPKPEFSASDFSHMNVIFSMLSKDPVEAKARLAALVKQRPDDKPLANLLHRIEHTEPGGFYVLD